jgi:hypothetical protein
MRVVVEFLTEAREGLLKLLTKPNDDPGDGLRAAIVYCEAIERVFKEYGAPPPGAILRPRGDEGSWWLFANGVWLAFTNEDEYVGARPFRRELRRTFTVVAAEARPAGA